MFCELWKEEHLRSLNILCFANFERKNIYVHWIFYVLRTLKGRQFMFIEYFMFCELWKEENLRSLNILCFANFERKKIYVHWIFYVLRTLKGRQFMFIEYFMFCELWKEENLRSLNILCFANFERKRIYVHWIVCFANFERKTIYVHWIFLYFWFFKQHVIVLKYFIFVMNIKFIFDILFNFIFILLFYFPWTPKEAGYHTWKWIESVSWYFPHYFSDNPVCPWCNRLQCRSSFTKMYELKSCKAFRTFVRLALVWCSRGNSTTVSRFCFLFTPQKRNWIYCLFKPAVPGWRKTRPPLHLHCTRRSVKRLYKAVGSTTPNLTTLVLLCE